MSKNITLELRSEARRYQIETIAGHYCKSIVPASVIEMGNSFILCYQMEGYTPLATEMKAKELFVMISELINLINDMEDYLFFEGDYILTPETLFYNTKKSRYEIVFKMPENDDSENELISFLKMLPSRASDEGQYYLEKLIDYIQSESPDKRQIFSYIEKQLEEINACGIE